MGTRVSEDFQFQVYGSRNNRKCTGLVGLDNKTYISL